MKMMIYRRDKKPSQDSKLWRRFLGGLVVLGLLFSLGSWGSGSVGWAAVLAKPFWWVGQRIRVGTLSLFGAFADKGELLAENEALTSKLEDLEIALLRQEVLVAENEDLRAALGLPQVISKKIVAQVLVGPSNVFDTFLVDTGSDYHPAGQLAVGDLVGLEGSLALGRVIAVEPKVTKIKLFSAPGSELPAMLGAESAPIKLIGRGLGNFVAEVPRGVKVNIGDRALFNLSATSWLIAEVGAVDRAEAETSQQVLLRTSANLSQLSYVEIYHN